jgi:hypothetical protein
MIDNNCICIIFNNQRECSIFYTKIKKNVKIDKKFSLVMKMYMNIYFNISNCIGFNYILIYNKKTRNVLFCLLTSDIKYQIKKCIIYNDAETFFKNMDIEPTYEPKQLVYE